MTTELSRNDARRLFLRAQGFVGKPPYRDVPGMLRHIGAVQLDTISVMARSHELVAYARLGPVGREAVEQAYWGKPPQAFEYWGHAASVIPLEEWPWYAVTRRRWSAEPRRAIPEEALAKVRAVLEANGPITTADIGGAKKGGPWWDWSDAKRAVEHLLITGEVACVERRGWRRVYDLAERVVPEGLRVQEPSSEECYAHFVEMAARRLGVGTLKDLADYYRLKITSARVGLEGAGLVPVTVEGWDEPAWAHPEALSAGAGRGRHRTTLLSPFDSLVWDRARTERVFDFRHRLEAYVPKHLRTHGYFTMLLLHGGRLVGKVDPKRDGRTLIAQGVTAEPGAEDAMAAALEEAATWVGCDTVVRA